MTCRLLSITEDTRPEVESLPRSPFRDNKNRRGSTKRFETKDRHFLTGSSGPVIEAQSAPCVAACISVKFRYAIHRPLAALCAEAGFSPAAEPKKE